MKKYISALFMVVTVTACGSDEEEKKSIVAAVAASAAGGTSTDAQSCEGPYADGEPERIMKQCELK